MATQVRLDVIDAEHVLPELAATHLPMVGLRVVRRRAAGGDSVHGQQLPAGGPIEVDLHNLVVPHVPAITERGKVLAARIGVMGSDWPRGTSP